MLPRPFHRSLTLWSGMLVMVFLCWAWWDSFQRDTWRTGRHFSFSNVAGAVSLGCHQANLNSSAGRRNINPHAEPRPAFAAFSFIDSNSKMTLPPYELNSGETLRIILSNVPSGAYAFLNVPHWLLILISLIPWGLLLAWRWRRVKRETKVQNEHQRIAVPP